MFKTLIDVFAVNVYETNVIYLVELRGLDVMASVHVQVYVKRLLVSNREKGNNPFLLDM